MAKTISELCIANTGGDSENASYLASGYHNKNGKIEEFAVELKFFQRNQGALNLVAEILLAPKSTIEEIPEAEKLIQRTRLAHTEDTQD